MKKILIPIMEFSNAGGFRVLSKLADKWIESGNDVIFIVSYGNKKPYYSTKASIKYLENYDRNLLSSCFKLVKFFDKQLETNTLILANQNLTVWPVLFSRNKNKFYYIQAYEPEFYDGYTGNILKRYILKTLAWLTYIMPLTRIVNASIYKNYKNIKSKYVIPPGLDLNIYYPKKLTKENKKTLVVGCIGRVEEWKGSQDVGRAVEILHKKGIDIKLKVAFNSIDYKNHELVKPHGDENLANYYRSLDVLVAPGHIQLGAVHYPVIEGMACNVPVITTGYYPAINENAFLVPIKSPEKIAEILENIYYNYEEAYNKAVNAQEKIKEFSWEIVAQKFLDIIEKEMRNNENEKI
ncbi:MAG: glycosyltransferase family 4 protein [Cetobacterium sp.]